MKYTTADNWWHWPRNIGEKKLSVELQIDLMIDLSQTNNKSSSLFLKNMKNDIVNLEKEQRTSVLFAFI